MKKNRLQQGTTLMEIVVVTAILSTISLAFLGTFMTVSKFHEKNMKAIKAGLLAEEGIEALRVIKSQDFNILASLVPPSGVSSDHYLAVATSTWSVTTTPEVIDGTYYRYFKLEPIFRTVTYDLVGPGVGGIRDNSAFFADVHVEWLWRNATNTNTYRVLFTNI